MKKNNKEKDVDKILGMNRTMFFVIVILLCILSLSIGIYAQFFYRYSKVDPFMLGIGVGKSKDNDEINKLKTEFNKIFTNDLTGTASSDNIKKKDQNKDIVFTTQTTTQSNIKAYIPKINIDSNYAEKINAEINDNYVTQITSIIDSGKDTTNYSVSYKAYLNGDLLSLIIMETIHKENETTQSTKIKTYNYNLNNNTEVSISDLIEAKGYTEKELQQEINTEMENLNKNAEALKDQYTVRVRDLNDSMYKIENTENFMVNDQGYLYLIYAYGNTEDTNSMDVLIFE